jgi:hypothetical protein
MDEENVIIFVQRREFLYNLQRTDSDNNVVTD